MSQNLQTVVADLESSVIQVYQKLYQIMEQENIAYLDLSCHLKFILLHQPEHPYFCHVWRRYQNAFKAFEMAIGKEGIESQLDYVLIDATFNECLDLEVFKVLYMQKLYDHFQLDFQDVRQQLYTKFYFFNPPAKEKYQVTEDNQTLRSRSCAIM
ncbi:MAG: hypothetical protein EBQ95_06565 [Gammaproteobacteria bacterium]|nr:hypothetical protein [Gammaproteobacteria bacterium]